MKHYCIEMKLFGKDGHIADNQLIEFIPADCRYQGVVLKKAAPNKRIVFSTLTSLVEACMDSVYEDECDRWEIRVTESDNEDGTRRYINFWSWNIDARDIYTEFDGNTIECGSRYDEYFDGWLF